LPITPVGKLKALGTAGSVYAIADFSSINEQMVNRESELSPTEQAKSFIDQCHKRGIRVIVDLPSCGSYDLFLKRPELFIKDDKNLSIVPSDWTDVRLLNVGTNENLNKDVMDEHKKFVDLVLDIGADGIRADVATIKPANFWVELINYARSKDAEFLFLAEASDSWRKPPSKYADFTPYDELLALGFDGYYGSFFNLKEWNGNDLTEHIKFNNKLLKSYDVPKSVIMSFTTHDEVSPVILHGEDFSVMIAWLEAVLPYNPYIIDGFSTGDDYIYPWANAKARVSQTDDDYYFVHRGKLDIFNFSRKPQGKSDKILENLKRAYKFRQDNEEIITKGNFIPLKTENDKVFAFLVYSNQEFLLVVGNLDFKNGKSKIVIKDSKIKKNFKYEIINGQSNIKFQKKKFITSLNAGEIKVLKITN
jgi:glycosidase